MHLKGIHVHQAAIPHAFHTHISRTSSGLAILQIMSCLSLLRMPAYSAWRKRRGGGQAVVTRRGGTRQEDDDVSLPLGRYTKGGLKNLPKDMFFFKVRICRTASVYVTGSLDRPTAVRQVAHLPSGGLGRGAGRGEAEDHSGTSVRHAGRGVHLGHEEVPVLERRLEDLWGGNERGKEGSQGERGVGLRDCRNGEDEGGAKGMSGKISKI